MKKTCRICGREFENHGHISKARFAEQPTCGRKECTAESKRRKAMERRDQWAKDNPRRCPCCGEVLVLRPGEPLHAFKHRKTCGREGCRQRYMRAKWSKRVHELDYTASPIVYPNEADRIQAEINLAYTRHMAERCGLKFDPGRVLPVEEVKELVWSGAITPILQIPDYSKFEIYGDR